MKSKLKLFFNWLKAKNENGTTNRWVIFAYCVVVSFVFWLLIVFSNEYRSAVSFNIRYSHLPHDKMLANKLPAKVDMEVSASGFTFLGSYFNQLSDTLLLDVSKIYNSGKSKEYYMPLGSQTLQFEKQLGSQIKIQKIYLDTLHFYFDKKSFRVVPVKLNLTYACEKQFQLNGKVTMKPSQIVVQGPASVVDKIHVLNTETINLSHLKQTTLRAVKIVTTEEMNNLEFSTLKVFIKIPVEKFTEASIELPVDVVNLPEFYSIKTFPDKVKITYLVGLSNYEKVNAELFALTAAYDKKEEGATSLKLNLSKAPDFIRNPRMETDKVEFILRKK